MCYNEKKRKRQVLQVISSTNVVLFSLALALTLAGPLVLLLVLGLRRRIHAAPLFLGAAAFFVSQFLLRIPLLNFLSGMDWFRQFAAQTLPYALCLALSAGLFEESARLGGALLLRRHRSYRDALSFGLGHGLCEVLLLTGLTNLNNILMCYLVNSGLLSSFENGLPQAQFAALSQAAAQLAAVSPLDILASLVERVSAVLFHLFATVLIFRGVAAGRKGLFYLAALGAHTAFNLPVVLVPHWGVWPTELLLLVLAGGATGYTVRARRYFPRETPVAEGPEPRNLPES